MTPRVPGLELIELPLPSSLASVNVYLVRQDDGYLLIDCGMNTPDSLAALTKAVEGLGIEWKSIRRILATHTHPDHTGLAPKLLRLTGARMIMHRDEAARLAAIETAPTDEDLLRNAGVPPEMMVKLAALFVDFRKHFRPLVADELLLGGERIPSALGDLEVIWTRGHSPGHVCLYAAERRLLFSGDQILPGITPNISWQQDHDALGEYLESLERLSALEVDLVLPSHGAPFPDHRQWVRDTVEHHAERCRLIKAALDRGVRTPHDLVGQLWDRELSPLHHWFAIYEVLAHLEYMKRRGGLPQET